MPVSIRAWDDPTSWNQFVSSLPYAHFQQSWEWGEIAPSVGGRVVRLGAERDGELCAAMQVFINPLHRTGKTHLYIPRGPMVSEPSLQILGPVFDAARRLGTDERAVGVRIEPNMASSDITWQCALRALGFRPSYPPTQPRSSWVLDVDKDEDSLLAGMKQKTRYNIRLATRKGVKLVESGVDGLDNFYAMYVDTAKRDNFFIHRKSFYANLFEVFARSGGFALLFAYKDDRPLAAITLVRFGRTCWYLHGASSNEHRNLMATYLLQWEGIQWAKRHNCVLYDFRAIPDLLREDQDMFGVYRFKEGFGGRQFTTLHTYAAPYQQALFGMWQLYFSGRFAVDARKRKRQGLPARQFA